MDTCRYATGSSLSGPDALIQDFYAAECSNAVGACSSHMLCAPSTPHSSGVCSLYVEGCQRLCMPAQVHLTVDTAMDTGSLSIAAFIARKLNLGEQKLARKFQEVKCEIDTEEIETVGGVHISYL